MPTNSKIAQSFFVYLKDPNTGIIKKIAFTCDIQIGSTSDNSMMLKLFGGLALSTTQFDTSISPIVNITKHSSYVDIKTSTISLASTITINLPSDPVDGQTHFIKDTSGIALLTPMNVFSPTGLIDGDAFKSITTNYGSLIVYSMNDVWYVLSTGGTGGDTTSQFVVMDYSATLTNERKLTAGSGISLTDGGPGNPVTVSNTLSSSAPGADVSASYLVLSNTSSLSNERAFTPGLGLIATDAGANSTYTLGINNSIVATISGSTFAQLSGSLQQLANAVSYLIAGQNVAITSSSTGQVIISVPTGSSFPGARPLWSVPDVPHVDDVEFDSSIPPSGWEVRNLTDATAVVSSSTINPYASITAANTAVLDTNVWRKSFMSFQGSTGGSFKFYSFCKQVTVPTNRFIWARIGFGETFSGNANDGTYGIMFADSSGGHATGLNNNVAIVADIVTGNTIALRSGKVVATAFTAIHPVGGDTINSMISGIGSSYSYIGIHKIGTTYHFWAFTESGQKQYWGSTTHATTMTSIGYVYRCAISSAPGNTIFCTDFFRNIDSATLLPT